MKSIVVAVIFSALMIALPSWAADEAGLIKVANGTVVIERGGRMLNASAGTAVLIGDRITTGEESSVGITLRDNTLLSAGPKSTLLLNAFVFRETTHDGTLDASIKRGTLSVVSGKLPKNPSNPVIFRTPAAILGVRGTEFAVDAGTGQEE